MRFFLVQLIGEQWPNGTLGSNAVELVHSRSFDKKIKQVNPAALLEMPYDVITQEHYNLRHDQEVMYSDEVYAFQVNDSTGTQDTIDKSSEAGLPITNHKKYKI